MSEESLLFPLCTSTSQQQPFLNESADDDTPFTAQEEEQEEQEEKQKSFLNKLAQFKNCSCQLLKKQQQQLANLSSNFHSLHHQKNSPLLASFHPTCLTTFFSTEELLPIHLLFLSKKFTNEHKRNFIAGLIFAGASKKKRNISVQYTICRQKICRKGVELLLNVSHSVIDSILYDMKQTPITNELLSSLGDVAESSAKAKSKAVLDGNYAIIPALHASSHAKACKNRRKRVNGSIKEEIVMFLIATAQTYGSIVPSKTLTVKKQTHRVYMLPFEMQKSIVFQKFIQHLLTKPVETMDKRLVDYIDRVKNLMFFENYNTLDDQQDLNNATSSSNNASGMMMMSNGNMLGIQLNQMGPMGNMGNIIGMGSHGGSSISMDMMGQNQPGNNSSNAENGTSSTISSKKKQIFNSNEFRWFCKTWKANCPFVKVCQRGSDKKKKNKYVI